MNDMHSPFSYQAANLQHGGKAPKSRRNIVHDNACIPRLLRKQRIANCDQFGVVAPREQSAQEQKRLMLSTAVTSAQVDDQRAHAQASPGFGHGRCVSFSPARSLPSLRYLM